MLNNYFKIAVRNILKTKGYTLLNIIGLAVGLTCFVLISLYIADELSYDKFHDKGERIFRPNTIHEDGRTLTSSSLKLGPELKHIYPEVESYTRVIPWARSLMRFEDKVFDERGIYLVDSTFFEIFAFNFVDGNAAEALSGLFSVVISQRTAEKYFGNDNPIGKRIYSEAYQRDFVVGGVIENVPHNSHFQFDIAARIELMPEQRMNSWEYSTDSFILLGDKVNAEEFGIKIRNFYSEHVSEEWEAKLQLQNFRSIHLYENGTAGAVKRVYIFSAVALLILIISIANYINLSTARMSKRANEIGLRKIVGARKRQLIFQLLTESIILALLASFFALVLVEMLLPHFNNLVLKNISISDYGYMSMLLSMLLMSIIVGILSGIYPALVISSFKPVSILKGKGSGTSVSRSLRGVLSIFQFSLSIALIICTIIISQQLSLIQNKDLGFNREEVLQMPSNPELMKKYDSYKSELLKVKGISNVSASATLPYDVGQFIGVNWEGNMDNDQIGSSYTVADYDYFETLGMKMLMGRTFSKEYASDSVDACIINETLMKIMGDTNPLGKTLYFGHPAFPEEKRLVKIIGVVKDFNSLSLYREIQPFVFRIYRPWHFTNFIKLNTANVAETIDEIKSITKQFSPDYPFEYEFMDEGYNRLYTAEIKTSKTFNVFSVIAIFISCLGLLGLTSFTVEQKRKEIGIRKVLGGSAPGIFFHLSAQFIKWVLIANIIAWPVSYYLMLNWLEEFAYKINLTLYVFAISGAIALLTAVFTVSYQTLRASLANPVESLKYE